MPKKEKTQSELIEERLLKKRREQTAFDTYVLKSNSFLLVDVKLKFTFKEKKYNMTLEKFYSSRFVHYILGGIQLSGIGYSRYDEEKFVVDLNVCYQDEIFFVEDDSKISKLTLISNNKSLTEFFDYIDKEFSKKYNKNKNK